MDYITMNFDGRRLHAPDMRQILFINQRYDRRIDDFFDKHYEECRTLFKNRGYDFIYAPKIYTPEFCWELLTYNFPEMPANILESRLRRNSLDYILDYPVRYLYDAFTAVYGQTDQKFFTGLVTPVVTENFYSKDHYPELCNYKMSGTRQFRLFPLDLAAEEEMFARMEEILEWKQENDPEPDRCLESRIGWTSDDMFPEEAYKLMDEIRERVELLRGMGVNEMILRPILDALPGWLSELVITSDLRILLPNYEKEIILHPLPKAVFFLFLRHPEGIRIKCMSDYRDELLRIYRQIMGDRYDSSMEESIDKLTTPYHNSINEKCSRIREAFLKEMDESVAQYYFVTGQRATAKRIRLDRKMVRWEREL
jgi:hypothetical protein